MLILLVRKVGLPTNDVQVLYNIIVVNFAPISRTDTVSICPVIACRAVCANGKGALKVFPLVS